MSILFLLLLFCRTDGFAKALSASLPDAPANQVKVCIERQLPALSTPERARKEFLKFVWENGGGLPMFVLPRKTREKTPDLETTLERRKLFPILMEEELVLKTQSSDSASVSTTTSCQLQYQVKNGGLLSTEIVPGSHLGTVTFAPQQETGITSMTWDVVFDTKEASRTFLWQFVTERTIKDSCNNFQMAMAVPRLYQRTTMISFNTKSLPASATPEKFMMDQWIQFCWREGSGFPLPFPPIMPNGDEVRWIVPPFLKERLLSINATATVEGSNDLCSEILYQVDNPSIFTYQVHSHHGRIRFIPVSDDKENDVVVMDVKRVQMDWQIEIRPYHGFSDFVEAFTGAVVSCYARNFKCHVQEGPDAMVDLKPPRGGGSDTSSLLQIRKDSWLGGVLDAHLQDRRSTFDQSVALFQPWTWGRSAKNDDEGESEVWVGGYLSD